jgi:hypothetical protein
MQRTILGVTLLLISAMLFIARYITAAIIYTGFPERRTGPEYFSQAMKSGGIELSNCALIALILGVLLLCCSAVQSFIGAPESKQNADA